MVARVWGKGLTVWANSILGIEPVNEATVRVYSRNNQLLASGTTDENGLFTHSREEAWDPQLLPAIVTVEKGDDVSFLKLEEDILATSGFDVDGRSRADRYEALLFAPRGVFRPGEKVDFSAIVRTKDFLPPEPFPVVYVVRSSLGREIARGTALLSEEGVATFAAQLAPASPTGSYTAVVALPGSENDPIGRTSFFVEDFVAPRLEVRHRPTLRPSRREGRSRSRSHRHTCSGPRRRTCPSRSRSAPPQCRSGRRGGPRSPSATGTGRSRA